MFGAKRMKKALSAILIAASLLYLLSSCSGHFLNKPTQSEPELTAAERLMLLSPWQTRAGDGELSFSADFTGRAGAMPFAWSASSRTAKLQFFPECSVGERYLLSLDFSGGACKLSSVGKAYYPQLIIAPVTSATASAEPQPTAEELLGQEIADAALNFIGWNYKYGGKSPETGFDCSGLVYYLYEQFGYRLQRVAADQAKQGVEVSHDELMPGDLLGFYTSSKYVGHIGIYVGKGYYVHAMGSAYGVVLTPLDSDYSKRDYTARRIIGCEELKIDYAENAG